MKMEGYVVTEESYIRGELARRGIQDVMKAYDKFLREFSCKPDRRQFPLYKPGDVIDEDKSVKWNREQAERAKVAFDDEVKRLNRQKSAVASVYREVVVKLASKDAGVSTKEGAVLWRYAEMHGDSVYEVKSYFDDYAEMYLRTLEVRPEKHKSDPKEKGHKEKGQKPEQINETEAECECEVER